MLMAFAVVIAAVSLCMLMAGLFGWGPSRAGHGNVGQAIARIVLGVVAVLGLIAAAALASVANRRVEVPRPLSQTQVAHDLARPAACLRLAGLFLSCARPANLLSSRRPVPAVLTG